MMFSLTQTTKRKNIMAKFNESHLMAASMMQKLDTELIDALAKQIMEYSIDNLKELIAEEKANGDDPVSEYDEKGIRDYAINEVDELTSNFRTMLLSAIHDVKLKAQIVVAD